MERLIIEELPRPALLDPNFLNQATSAQSADDDNAIFNPNKLHVNSFSLGLTMGLDGFLEQRELQQLRGLLKSYIKVLQNEVAFCKAKAHFYHEHADVNRAEETADAFKAHSIYRSRGEQAKKLLRSMETIQRKIRLQLSHS